MNIRSVLLSILLAAFVAGAVFQWQQVRVPDAAYKTLDALTKRQDVRAAARSAPRVDVKALDARWVAEAKARNDGPLITSVMTNSLSMTLAKLRESSKGHIEQIMVMDARGALIAADHPTHDFDQSDEPKWQKTVSAGETEPVWDGNDRGVIDQIAQSITAPNGKIIGAVLLRWCKRDHGCD